MYCSNCGSEEKGNYCSRCGAELAVNESVNPEEIDWSSETSYSTLLRIPEVRELISLAAQKSKKTVSVEELFDLFGDALKPVTGGVSLGKLASFTRPVSSRFGIKVEKIRSSKIASPPGKTIVDLLCLFAGSGQKVINVEQAEDGCIIEATIPSDILSWEGTVLVIVRRHHGGTLVEATTTIKGQLYDFGKSERYLDKLFKYVEAA